MLLIAQFKLAVGLEHAGWGSVRLADKLDKLMQHFFVANVAPRLVADLQNQFADDSTLVSPNVAAVLSAQRKHIAQTLDLCQFKRSTGEERRVDMKHLMVHMRKWKVLNDVDVTYADLAKSRAVDVKQLADAYFYATHPTEPDVEVGAVGGRGSHSALTSPAQCIDAPLPRPPAPSSLQKWRLRKVPLMVNLAEFETMLVALADRIHTRHIAKSDPVESAFELFLLRFLEDIFLKVSLLRDCGQPRHNETPGFCCCSELKIVISGGRHTLTPILGSTEPPPPLPFHLRAPLQMAVIHVPTYVPMAAPPPDYPVDDYPAEITASQPPAI